MFAPVKFCLGSLLTSAWLLPSNSMSLFIAKWFSPSETNLPLDIVFYIMLLWILGNTFIYLESKLSHLTALTFNSFLTDVHPNNIYFMFEWPCILLLPVSKMWAHYSILHIFCNYCCLFKLKYTILVNTVRGPAREQFSNLRLSLHIV